MYWYNELWIIVRIELLIEFFQRQVCSVKCRIRWLILRTGCSCIIISLLIWVIGWMKKCFRWWVRLAGFKQMIQCAGLLQGSSLEGCTVKIWFMKVLLKYSSCVNTVSDLVSAILGLPYQSEWLVLHFLLLWLLKTCSCFWYPVFIQIEI